MCKTKFERSCVHVFLNDVPLNFAMPAMLLAKLWVGVFVQFVTKPVLLPAIKGPNIGITACYIGTSFIPS